MSDGNELFAWVVRIPGEPFAQPRARAAVINGRAIVYDPKAAKNWKATAQQHMAYDERGVERGPVLSGPVGLTVLAVFTCPKTDHRKRDPRGRRWHVKRPDADNVMKAVKDAAKGVLWLDDSQVCRETCIKIIGAQGEAPYVQVSVTSLTDGDPRLGHVALPPLSEGTTNGRDSAERVQD